jgi:uncharacterized protein
MAVVDASVLLAFRAANVRSFRDAFELSFLATAVAEQDVPREVAWYPGSRPLRVVPAAGIFGANGSGKSNLLRAMNDMRDHVLYSFRSGDPEGGVPRYPFRMDSSVEQPSRYEIELVIGGVKHEYGFVIDDERVLREQAFRYPKGKKSLLFERDGDGIRLGEGNRAKGRAVTEIVRPNALFLSAAGTAGHPDLAPLYQWFGRNLMLAEASSRPFRWAYTTEMLRDDELSGQVLAFMRAADLGITGTRMRELDPETLERFRRATRILNGREEEPEGADAGSFIPEPGVVLSHRGARGDVELDTADESLGTLVWLGLAGPVIHALSNGQALLVDELEASLHPSLVRQMVLLFQDPETNPKRAQLIFNTHEVSLLGDSSRERVLGRDQVWFTEKTDDGASRLYRLTELSPRQDEAIGKRYLDGRYGATPILARQEFAAAVAESE